MKFFAFVAAALAALAVSNGLPSPMKKSDFKAAENVIRGGPVDLGGNLQEGVVEDMPSDAPGLDGAPVGGMPGSELGLLSEISGNDNGPAFQRHRLPHLLEVRSQALEATTKVSEASIKVSAV
ncbi:hypothetical protein C8R43DRAFT_948876 [Mycena crocata]|nr:hypothetical protein C8R43DRAFT_948876 [Mycena crocata]